MDEAVKGDGKNMERLEENRLGGFSASRRNEGWNGIVRRLFAYYGACSGSGEIHRRSSGRRVSAGTDNASSRGGFRFSGVLAPDGEGRIKI